MPRLYRTARNLLANDYRRRDREEALRIPASGRITGAQTSLRAAVDTLGLPAGSMTSYPLRDVEDRPEAPPAPAAR